MSEMRIKLSLLGDGYVGKTSIKRNYMGKKFTATYLATIGADFSIKETNHRGKPIKYMIWDLAGQQAYAAVRSGYYLGSKGIVLVYDVTNRNSYENIPKWLQEFKNIVKEPVPTILVGNKIDLRESVDNSISQDEGVKLAKELENQIGNGLKVSFFETSAKTGENIEEAFKEIGEDVFEKFSEFFQD